MAEEASQLLLEAEGQLAANRPSAAAGAACRALQLYQQAGDREGAAAALGRAVAAHLRAGGVQAALAVAKEALAASKQGGDAKGEAAALQALAEARLADGAADAAMAAARRAREALKGLGDAAGQARALKLIAWVQFGKGYWELALRAAREARRMLDGAAAGEAPLVLELETLIASAHHARGEEPPSSACRGEALRVVQELGLALERRSADDFKEVLQRLQSMGGYTDTDTNRVFASELEKDPEGAEAFLAAHMPPRAPDGLQLAPAQDVCCLRTFLCALDAQSGSSGDVEWTQSMWQITLTYQLRDGPRTNFLGGWAQDDVIVELSKSSLKVTLGGQPLKALSGELLEDVWRKDSWWAIEEEEALLVVHLYKRVGKTWRGVWYSLAGTSLRRVAFPWTEKMRLYGSDHNSPLYGFPPPDDLPDESQLEPLEHGRPEPEEDEPLEGGGYARTVPGGPFAPPSDRYICCAEDLCLGITAEQDSKYVTLQVHFERISFENFKLRFALERLLAADVWSNAVCIFFQGDKRNPIVWGELTGACLPHLTTWRMTSSEPMRKLQEGLGGYSPALLVRLRKAPESLGRWPKIFGRCMQAKLMSKSWEDGTPRYEGLPGVPTARRTGYDLESPDFWGFVDDYCHETLKKTGHSAAPRRLALA